MSNFNLERDTKLYISTTTSGNLITDGNFEEANAESVWNTVLSDATGESVTYTGGVATLTSGTGGTNTYKITTYYDNTTVTASRNYVLAFKAAGTDPTDLYIRAGTTVPTATGGATDIVSETAVTSGKNIISFTTGGAQTNIYIAFYFKDSSKTATIDDVELLGPFFGGTTTNDNEWSDADTFEIPIESGVSFTQSPNTSEITANESGSTPIRGKKVYNDSLNPVEVSFTTYIRPTRYNSSTAAGSELNKILWESLVGAGGLNTNFVDTANISSTAYAQADFDNSQTNQLLKLGLYFNTTDINYACFNAVVTSAEISFDIDSIAKINWTLQAETLEEIIATPSDHATSYTSLEDDNIESNFITNKLSTTVLTENSASITDGNAFNFNITGGSISIDNGVTFLTPETLSEVDKPINHFTSTLNISGSLSMYLRSSASTNDAGQLINNFLDDANSSDPDTTNDFTLTINLGGTSAPYTELSLPNAFVEIPTIEAGDIYSMNLNFHALEGTFGTTSANTPLRIRVYPETS